MKNWLSSILFLSIITVNAQEITDYEYIILPESFSDFKKNEFKLKNHLNQYLKEKQYKTLSFNSDNWPTEIKNNPCSALKADILKGKSFLNNKVEVQFLDCRQKIVFSTDGSSKIKEFEPGYQEAILLAMNKMPISNPKEMEIVSILKEPKETPIENTEKISPINTTSNTYSNGNITVEKVDLKDGGFMLMNTDTAQIIAKFQPSSKANVYRVTITENNYNTIGYTNTNTISYEVAEGNQVKEIIFKAK